ncbi:MAG: TonB-dependent receptor, partial [Candidatus Aminicenantes bacterium]
MTRAAKLTVIFSLFISCTLSLTAQGKLTGSLNGKVLDTDKNPLPGCVVTIQGPALQGKMSFVTSEAGAFRFPAVPPGEGYQCTFELPGFKTLIRKGLKVSVGKATAVSIILEMSALEEEVTVVGESPTVDVKVSKTAINYSKTYIYNIPLSRDLYDVLNSIPGSVSENSSYRRTSNIAGGTVRGNQYSLDGVIINDPVVMYPMTNINIDVFEEVEMGLFGHAADVSFADGGFINIVTKSGSDEYHGGAAVEFYNEDMQWPLLSQEDLHAVGLEEPTGWNSWQDFSLFLGGPIFKDRIWFFINGRYFKWARDFNHVIWDDTVAAGTHVYTLDEAPHKEMNLFGKLTFQFAPNIRFMGTYNLTNITEDFYTNRIGNDLDVTATSKWDGETDHTLSGQLNWILGQNLFIDARVGYIRRWFPLPYTSHAIPEAPLYYDRYYKIRKNNPWYNETYLRRRFNPSVITTLFIDQLFGASHEIKFGAEFEQNYGNWDYWRQNPWMIYFYKGSPYSYATPKIPNRGLVFCFNTGNSEGSTVSEEGMRRFGLFVQDSVTFADRITLNLGIRFDTSEGYFPDQHHSSVVDPYGILDSLKGTSDAWDDYALKGLDILSWTHLSPRVGISYDVFGNGKTSIRGSWSRYKEYLMIQYFSLANPMAPTAGYWFWFDLDFNRTLENTDLFWPYYMPPTIFDFELEKEVNTNATAPFTDELTIGVEGELAEDFSLSVVFIYKHKKNIFEDVNDYGLGREEAWKGYREDSPFYEKFIFEDPGDDGLFGTEDDQSSYLYAELADAPATHYYLNNIPEAFRKYWAINFIFKKRMSNNWQLLGSIVYSKAWGNIGGGFRQTMGESSNFDDPNTWVFCGGRLDYDRPLNIKLQSTVILPYGFILSGYYNFLSGSPWARSVSVILPDDPKYKYPGDTCTVRTEPSGTRRNPPQTTLDLRVEKRFHLSKGFSIGVYVDIMNALGRSGFKISSDPGG